MTDLTEARAQYLDARRTIYYGVEARLVLMTHAQVSGYAKGPEVLRGWCPDDEEAGAGGESVGQVMIEVCESETITAEMLSNCAGFAFLRKGESAAQTIYHKVVGRVAPLDAYVRNWVFLTTPNRKERISI